MMRRVRSFIIFLFFVSLCFTVKYSVGQQVASDSIRVLFAKYDECNSGADGIVTMSLLMEKDSVQMPIYSIGDSTVLFPNEIRVSAIKSISYVNGAKIPKKMRKTMPNGLVAIKLNSGENYPDCQVLPSGKGIHRKAFVTRLSFADLNNENGKLSQLAEEFVSQYGTDDGIFRANYVVDNNASAILAIDSTDRRAFVNSLQDFKPGTIENINAFDAESAVQLVGDKGYNGLIVVFIKSGFTLKDAVYSAYEIVEKWVEELSYVNITTLLTRTPIIIK